MTIPAYIFLNGQRISAEEIAIRVAETAANPSVSEWEKELFLFLNEWFSDATFVLAQTSGSTGQPKPIELPKLVMQRSAERTIEYFGLQKSDRLLLSLPCRYIAGKMMVVRAVIGQMNLITVDPSCDFDFLAHETFDFGAMVPNQVFKILQQPGGGERLQNIRNLLIGGSAISSELEARVSQLSSRIVLTYGMTETASHVAIRELSGSGKSDYYRCLPGISVGMNDPGCLQIHVPEFGEPLQTNDLAELQSDTCFRILGRADSVIISGGIKYSPETLERKLEGLLRERFVISSVPDPKLGEKLALVVEGKPFSTESLTDKLRTLLPSFEQPKTIVFMEKFPETVSGKVQRNVIKESIRTGIFE